MAKLFLFLARAQLHTNENLLRTDLDKVEKLDAVIRILRQIITSGTVIKCSALFRSCKRVAWLAFLADHHGILSGIGGLFNSRRRWGRFSPPLLDVFSIFHNAYMNSPSRVLAF